MSNYHATQYTSFQEPQVFLTTTPSEYGQYGDSRRSKSPSSLINHPVYSPGPLSTPPMSRNVSQPAPDQTNWEDAAGSLSNSPTSIGTPDHESFEVQMLDDDNMREYYNHDTSAALVTTQVPQSGLPAIDTSMQFFTDQVLEDALSASIASQQAADYQLFHAQTQQSQAMIPTHPYNQNYSSSYVQQPSHQDPWSSQRPPYSPEVPRSGDAVFDPASSFVHPGLYTSTNTNYLLSSSAAVSPSQVNHFTMQSQTVLPKRHHVYTNLSPVEHSPIEARGVVPLPSPIQYHGSYHNISPTGPSPIETRVTEASPSPDSGGFVNYHPQSAFFTEQYITDTNLAPASPNVSVIGQPSYTPYGEQISRSSSNTGHASLSPYPATISPQALSPGGSDVMFSYQNSDPGMMDHFNLDTMDTMDTKPSTGYQEQLSFLRYPGGAADHSHEIEPQHQSHSPSKGHGNGRPGGRALGTHLEPTVAKQAHDMRKIVACWHCVLQRDKCGPGDVCDRCMKRSQRANADCGLGCSRIKLIELAEYFLPTLVTQMHEDAQLTHFVSRHIAQWGNQEITIHMTCGQKEMPRIPVKVYEFLPKGNELLVLIQYKTDPKTLERVQVRKQSPPLGMVHINHNEEKRYDQYISDIVDNHIEAFGALCWLDSENDFQHKLFRLMIRLQPKGDDEAKLYREVFRLIVCTFIMSHTLTIAEETKIATLSKMHSYQGRSSYVENFTSPRMTNRQLKYFFNRLQRSIMSTVLNKLQQIFKSSKGCDKWLPAFFVVVGMCMAHEDHQQTVHLSMSTKAATENRDARDMQAQAEIACREIDARMGFIAQIFRWKYNRKCNPLRDADHAWEKEVGFSDPSSVNFIRSVAQLVKENIDFLQTRQSISISSANQTKYTSRLVGQFLLSFWLPQM